ncbi:MAG: NAD(P)H-dependent glycerol-3-phosphate dehydrogenase [bacterium]|nr:NAD(P)H-dependent glycerol-3-phosphate dehydrogenase [bacterium]
MKITVLEPGVWGTVLGILLSKKNTLNFWYENAGLAAKISKTRENEKLTGIKIPPEIFISSGLKKAIKDTDLIVIASPSFNFRQILASLKKVDNLPPLLGIAKGIEKKTLKVPLQVAEEILGTVSYAHLSGPGFAKEIIEGKLAKEVIASEDKGLLKKLKEVFDIRPLEVSFTTDLIGVQLAGALKNALAIGISLVEAGIENPENKKITKDLVRQGVKEMIKIGKVMGAKKETFLGPAGKGDLILTSTNPLSRNFQFGRNLLLNADKMRKEILERKITVEGFDSVFALYRLGKIYKLDLPMINEIYKVIYQKVPPEKTIKNLIKLTK